MIQGVVFDMDGLLIDSEPLWREAEKYAFASVGVVLSPEQALKTMGLRTDEGVRYWYERYPWTNRSLRAVEEEIHQSVLNLIRTEGKAKDGVQEILEFFRSREIPIGLASSSSMELILTVLDHLSIRPYFDTIQSAEHEPLGKPHPAVYIKAAQEMGLAPELCLAFEDLFNGLLAAKSARMKAVGIPEAHLRHEPRFGVADVLLNSLTDFDEAVWNQLNIS